MSAMAALPLPDEFQQSFINCANYPVNLESKVTSVYRSTRQSYKQRLDDIECDLCLVEGEDEIGKEFEVHFRDLETADGKSVDKRNIHSPDEVTRWLGVDLTVDKADPNRKTVTTRKKHPKSRFIYVYAENSLDKLKVTRAALVQILTYHQVMPTYLDFMLVFGAQSDPQDLRFSGFREQTFLNDRTCGTPMPDVGKSGRHFQLSYNLKGVTFKKSNDENIKLNEWSIRQAAVHHQFDVIFGTTLWIVTKGRLDIQQRYKELTGPDGRPEDKSFDTVDQCFRSSLAAHLLYCHWSTEDWRWYIRWLENVIDAESSMVIYGPRGPGYAHRQYKPYHIQDLQYWQDKTNEAIMVLEANVKVIKAIEQFYTNLQGHKDFPDVLKRDCADDIASFDTNLSEIIDDFSMQIARAKLLGDIIHDRKELVLQHLQGQATERTEELNLNLEREAIVMRIITIVTLLYLPATFVSTFFSTDVIKYQNQGNGDSLPGNGTFSPTAMIRWLQVTLPLTAITLLIAWITYKVDKSARQGVKVATNAYNAPEQQSQSSTKGPNTGSSQQQSTLGPFQHFVKRLRIDHAKVKVFWNRIPILPLHKDSKGTT